MLFRSLEDATKQAETRDPNDPNLPALREQLKNAQAEHTALGPKVEAFEAPASRGFFTDILSDANGVAFHRLQVFAWTLVFWAIFMFTLIHKITLMDFDVTSLALMGISGATYLGFKLQQKQKQESDPATQ